MRLGRSWILLTGSALLVMALGLVATVGGVRRRAELLLLHATGAIPDMTWGDLFAMMPPHSGYDIEGLLAVRNPYVAMKSVFNDSSDVAAGRSAFRAGCAPCHGLDARGGAIAPDLTSEHYRHGASDWAWFRVITRGVPGTAMQAHALPRKTTWQIIAYLRNQKRAIRPDTPGPLSAPDSIIAELGRKAAAAPAAAQATPRLEPGVSAGALRTAGTDPAAWLTYSGTLDGSRHSVLSQINRTNAARLKARWVFPLPGGQTKFETSPLVVGHSMYLSAPGGEVYALDVRTGALLWSYTSRKLPGDIRLCCNMVNRGLAVFGTTLYIGTLDAHLLALDAATGSIRWDKEVADYREGFSITGAPLAVDGRVIIGVAGGEFGIRGFLDAYDAASGERAWRFYTIPAPGEPGHETWGGADAWKSGGGPTWMTGTFDPELNLVYWGVGNPGPNYQGAVRPGTNLYTNSVVAIDLASGKLRWYFQFTPHDEHDWDATETPILADAVVGGQPRKLLLEANRNGFYYVLDRTTGAFIIARAFVRQSWADGIDSTGRPLVRPESRPSLTGTLVYPGDAGGTNWWAPSYAPESNVFFLQVREGAGMFFNTPSPEHGKEGWFMGSNGESPANLLDYLAVRALDATTGKLLWEHRHTPDGGNVDAGIGGLLSTAGGLLFGGINGSFFALDAGTGESLWQAQTGGPIWAAPITYLTDGTQQVTVASNHQLITFSVDGQ